MEKTKADSAKDGFTLVELSVAFVVIGLLIGGILVAQSMISTSKVNATAMQTGQFDAMVGNFKTKYNYLPGDAPAFGGDGNGALTSVLNSASILRFDCEVHNFWINIDPQTYTGTTSCNGTGTYAVTKGVSKNVPLSKLGKDGSFFIASGTSIGYGSARATNLTSPQSYYIILDPSQLQSSTLYTNTGNSTCTNCPVKASDLLALDKKIDDGAPSTGNIMSGFIYNATLIPYWATGCGGGTVYSIQNSTSQCIPVIRIGAQAGDPQ